MCLENREGVAVARQLVLAGGQQHAFRAIMELNRADLTIESIMLEDEFRPLFTHAELAAAQFYLDNPII